jgi:hypothetical protein
MTDITLHEAKELSLKRWRAIRADYKDIKTRGYDLKQPNNKVYGDCGFCILHHNGARCTECELYPRICNDDDFNSNALYWKIVRHITNHKPGIYALINQMIKAIKEVKE